MRRADGEVILLWTLPVLGLLWISVFLLFPGFVQPMSPTMSAEEVAAFYRDPGNLPRVRYSMIVFNWFAVGLIPILALIVLQMRRMAHRTPIFSYGIIACAAGGPTIFLMASLFWLLAALDATLRELPSILSCPLAPKYLPLFIGNNDSYVGPVAIFVNHDGFSILNALLQTSDNRFTASLNS